MAIYFIDHAEKRFIERNISIDKIRELFKVGVIIDDIGEKAGRKICIYKEGPKYYSVVFQECEGHKIVITGYPSKEWEKRMYGERSK